jgi:hypothetical protein
MYYKFRSEAERSWNGVEMISKRRFLKKKVGMQVQEIANIINGRILTNVLNSGREISHAFASDLMSDVLTRDYEDTVLITGLANLQAIRTAEMSDIGLIIIARDKEVGVEMISLAETSDIVLIKSAYSLFRISGLLYEAGIKPIF